jgi:hypothetical protein
LTARVIEFGRSMRNFACAAELIRADSLSMRHSFVRRFARRPHYSGRRGIFHYACGLV